MAISLNQAYDIAQKLSNEQLMQAYTNGTLPQFVLFSEMELRQKEQKNRAQPPTQTVAERLVGAPPESSGIMQAAPEVPPQTAARGGIARSSPLDMGYSEDLPQEAKKIISMRLKAMRELEEEPQYAAEGGQLESQVPAPSSDNKPLTSRELADMLLHPVMMTESGGRQSAVSPKGAIGVMQIMPGTGPEAAKIAGVQWDPKRFKTDADYNTRLGHAYLTSMIDRFGDTEKALAAYNMGPTRLSGVLEQAKRTGADWRTMIPRETQGYLGKILGSRQALLPPRQTPEGADAEVPARYGNDPAFGGFLISDSGYKYPRQDNSVEKGLAALKAAQSVRGLRFAEGSDGEPVDPDAPSGIGGLTKREIEERIADEERIKSEAIDARIKAQEKASREKAGIPAAREALKQQDINPETGKPYSVLDKARKAMQTPSRDLATMTFGTVEPSRPEDVKAESATSPSIFLNPTTPPGWEPPPPPQSGSPIPTPLDPSKMPSTSSIDRAQAQKAADAEKQTAAAREDVKTAPVIPGLKITEKEGQDAGFNSVFKQVQDAIGTKIPDELKENMKRHQETLASMKNDKIVDALFAAAKTLAGQRVGSVNYGDAVANAGLAAQEAQKRIYKADDEMRKYRAELLKAQDDGNYKAASIAMNRIIQADHDRKALITASMQADKTINAENIRLRQIDAADIRSQRQVAEQELAKLLETRKAIFDKPLVTDEQRRQIEAEIAEVRRRIASYASGKRPEAADSGPSKEELKSKYGLAG